MDITWDPAKNARNIGLHDGVSFEEAASALDDVYALVEEDGFAENERRFKFLGQSALGRVLVVIYSYRESPETIRIISAWKAAAPARNRYERQR